MARYYALVVLIVMASLNFECNDEKDGYVKPVSIVTTGIADATENKPFNFSLTADGGAGTQYEWTLTEGQLPPGLSLLSSGVITGTPVLTGSFDFVIRVQEKTMPFISDNDYKSLTLAVKAWQRPVQITSASDDNHNPAICIDGEGIAHGVWEVDAPGNSEIHYSPDLGTIQASPTRISTPGQDAQSPSIVSDLSGKLHCVWSEESGTDHDIVYTSNDGTGWASLTIVSTSTNDSETPVVAVDEVGNVHVVWVENTGTVLDVLWSCYNSATWSAPQSVSNAAADCARPSVCADSSVYLVYSEGTGTSSEIYFTVCSGTQWTTPLNISEDSIESTEPDVFHRGAQTVIAWNAGPVSSGEPVFRVLTEDQWGETVHSGTTYSSVSSINVAIDGTGKTAIIWEGDSAIYSLNAVGVDFAGPILVSDESVSVVQPDITMGPSDRLYAIYSFDDTSNYQVGYSEFASRVWHDFAEIPTTGTTVLKAKTVVDSQDILHCVWQQVDSPGLRNIYYSFLEPGTTWSTPLLLSTNNTGLTDHPHIAVDGNDNLHAIWGGQDSGGIWQIWHAESSEGTWFNPLPVTDDTDDSYWPDLDLDSTGGIHVVFVRYIASESDQDIFYSASTNGFTWSAPSSVSNSTSVTSWSPSFVIDDSDIMHLTWVEGNDVAYCSSSNGVSWSSCTNISDNSGTSRDADIAVDNEGNIVIAWSDDTGGSYQAMYSQYNGTTWTAPDIIHTLPSGTGRTPNIIGHSGCFHAVWNWFILSGGKDIVYSSFDGDSWSIPVNLTLGDGTNNIEPTGGGLAIDSENRLYALFSESTTDILRFISK